MTTMTTNDHVTLRYDQSYHPTRPWPRATFQDANPFGIPCQTAGEPLFGDIDLDRICVGIDGERYGPEAVLILDLDDDEMHARLTVQLSESQNCYGAAFVKKFALDWTWPEVRDWAHKHITRTITARELVALGFVFEEF